MIDRVIGHLEFCKCHWKTIFIGSFCMHFIFDWFIFGFGFFLGMHIGH